MEIGALEIIVLAAALLIGVTGTWSPCGFSMVETIGTTGHTGGRRIALAACATFLPGALIGGLLTFGGLALLGSFAPGDDGIRHAVAACLALAAAVGEARGARIAPQIRRQLPEHWRRVMPMPVAAALYGGLLGLGFTTFVLSFGVWALAGMALAVGEPAVGLAIGVGFGFGRALPIVALAPISDRPAGRRAISLMAERPGIYRGIRLGDAIALVACAIALTAGATASAVVKSAPRAADPSTTSDELVYQRGESRVGILRPASGKAIRLPGTDPALGGGYVAVLDRREVVLLSRDPLEERDRVAIQGADALAVSRDWLVVRTRVARRDRIQVRPISPAGRIREPAQVAAVGRSAMLGRPSLDGDRIAYALATSRKNKLVIYQIGAGDRRTAVSSRRYALSNPAIQGNKLVYVRSKRRRDQLRVRTLDSPGDRLLKSGSARLWSTALSDTRAYVTVLEGTRPRPRIISVRR